MLKSQSPKPIKGTFEIVIQAERPDKRRRDLDNLVKPCNDLLVLHRVIEDDCLAEKITLQWIGPGKQIHIDLAPCDAEA
jgi:Holliday junction resolvase RusA-like endonuclease